MSSVSVIVVSYHTGPALWLAIDSILAQKECAELLLVNNGNVPGDERRLYTLSVTEPRFKFLSGHGNVGFARGCNLGAKAATGEFILLLNPDSMLEDGALACALEVMSRFPENTLAGCYLVNPDGSEQRGGRRAILTPGNAIAESLGLKSFNFNNTPMPAAAHEVPAISGAFMLLPRSFYNALGGMDKNYFLHMEDMDFCYRVHQAGGKVICMPEVKTLHFRSTSEAASGFVEKHKARGFIRYLKTHFTTQHSRLFLAFMSMGIWLRYWLKLIISVGDSLFVPPLAARFEIARLVLLWRLTRFSGKDETLTGKAILVTGASDQIGLCIVGKALAAGAEVIAVHNKTEIPFTHPRLSWLQADMETNALIDIKADILIHAAPMVFLPALLGNRYARAVAFSHAFVLDSKNIKNRREKKHVEQIAKAEELSLEMAATYNTNFTIFRSASAYGVGLDTGITRTADIIRRFGFLVLYKKAKGVSQPVQTLDLADAVLAAIANPATYSKTYNLGGEERITHPELCARIAAYQGTPVRFRRIPGLAAVLDMLGAIYQFDQLSGEMLRRQNRDLVFDISAAIDDFGFRPRGILQGDIVL